jgi:hypothetical protein
MLGTILGWLGNLLGGPFAKAAVDAYKAKLQAGNDHDRIAADLASKQLDLDRREADVQAQIVIAEQGNIVTRLIRPIFGLAAAILTWKLLVWDLALGQWTGGHTDKIGPQAYWLLTTIVIAYMGGRSVEKVADKIAGVLKK